MEKLIKIGNVEKTFRSNGATPIKYRRIFKGGDFFRDITKLKAIDADNLSDNDIESIEKIAFAMCEDANKPGMTFETWLEQFELFALVTAIPDIIGAITENLDTQAIANASKNADPAES